MRRPRVNEKFLKEAEIVGTFDIDDFLRGSKGSYNEARVKI